MEQGIGKIFKGLEIPALGFGTYRIKDSSIIKDAINTGYRHIDTAKSYHNEKEVGEAWKSSGEQRKNLFITTKIWHDRLKPDQIKLDIDDSLSNLRTDYVDLLLVHWPSTENVPLEDTLEAFNHVKSSGKTRAIGVSNFTMDLVRKAESITEIHCVQVEYHPFLAQQQLLEHCKHNNLALTAYRPIAKTTSSEVPILNELAKKYKKNTVQITLRWLIQQEPVLAIPRSANHNHYAGNLDIFDFELTSEEMTAIHLLNSGERQVNPTFAPNW